MQRYEKRCYTLLLNHLHKHGLRDTFRFMIALRMFNPFQKMVVYTFDNSEVGMVVEDMLGETGKEVTEDGNKSR